MSKLRAYLESGSLANAWELLDSEERRAARALVENENMTVPVAIQQVYFFSRGVSKVKRKYYAIAPIETEAGSFIYLCRFKNIGDLHAFINAGDDRARVTWRLARVMFPALNRGPESHKTFWRFFTGKDYEGHYLADSSMTHPVTAEYRKVS